MATTTTTRARNGRGKSAAWTPLRLSPSCSSPEKPAKPAPASDDPWSDTRVVKTMWPPQPGTRRLHDEHGGKLVCVRYRHDHEGRYRYTTVELMVDHAPVRHRDDGSTWVEVRVHVLDEDMRAKIKAAGGKWRPDTGTWLLTRKAEIRIGLGTRMKAAKASETRERK